MLVGNDQCVRESYECGTRSACSVSVLDFHPGVFDCIVTGVVVCVFSLFSAKLVGVASNLEPDANGQTG